MSKARISVALLLTALMLMSGLAMGCPPREPDPVVVDPDPVVVQPCPVVVDPVIPIRYGSWFDELIVTEVFCEATAITMLEADELDIFLSMLSCVDLYTKVVESPYMCYWPVLGIFHCILTNQTGVDGIVELPGGRTVLNPMDIPRIRMALNWLIDRDFVVEHLYGGMAVARWTVAPHHSADYSRYIETIRAIELEFAYDRARAKEVIAYEMKNLGAELVDGIWHWGGYPVEVIIISPAWSPPRVLFSDDFADRLDYVGFVGVSRPLTRGEWAGVIGDMEYMAWHLLTGGWIFPGIARDGSSWFAWFYTDAVHTHPIWLEKTPDPEFYYLADRLRLHDFATMEERDELWQRALPLSMEDSGVIFLLQMVAFVPHRYDVEVSGCVGGGVCSPNALWSLTLRHVDDYGNPVVGETIRMAQPTMFIDPWNPVHGSNIPADQAFSRGMEKTGSVADPFTGLPHLRLTKASVTYIYEGKLFPLPPRPRMPGEEWRRVPADHPRLAVPGDAIRFWCPLDEQFITAADQPPVEKVEMYSRIYFREDLWDIRLHDGSPLSFVDFLMAWMMPYMLGIEGSPWFCPVWVPFATGRLGTDPSGWRIVQMDPLIIETWGGAWPSGAHYGWPGQGSQGWHPVALGLLAKQAGQLAFGGVTAGTMEVDQMDFTKGPTLPYFAEHLEWAIAENFLPFEEVLGQFTTPAEIAERWANLQAFYEDRGHFYVSTGPIRLISAFPVEKIIHFERNPYYLDRVCRWLNFDTARVPDVYVSGPIAVSRGDEGQFRIPMTFEGEPFLVAEMDVVIFLVIDAEGEIAITGEAVAIEDGLWEVVLCAEATAKLPVGSTRLEVIASGKPALVPGFGHLVFILLP